MKALGDYELLNRLGDGYSGAVYLAVHRPTGARVALKAPPPDLLAKKPKIRAFFATEARVLSLFKHPFAIQLRDFQEEAEITSDGPLKGKRVPLLAIELAPNGELCDIILKAGRLSENSARFYFKQLMGVLSGFHGMGLVHRDIKPENVLFSESMDLRLIDFAFTVEEKDNAKNLVGTPGYIAPEILLKKGAYSSKTDVFAAGVVLFIMVRGMPPFNDAALGDPHYSMLVNNPKNFWNYHQISEPKAPCTPEFKELVQNMLCMDPAKRWGVNEVMQSAWMKVEVDEAAAKKDMMALVAKARANSGMM